MAFPRKPAASASAMNEFAAMLDAQLATYRKGFNPGERVRGLVLSLNATHAVLDVNAKREGLVALEELRDEAGAVSLKPGDSLEVIFVAVQDGAFIFTTRVSGAVAVDQSVSQALASGLPLEGTVQSEVAGGYEVTVAGRRAFCPFSQIALFKQEGVQHIGQKYLFIVQEYSEDGHNLVVSRRAVLEQEREAQRTALRAELQVGQARPGRVTRLVDFGFFVDIGGVEGLVPLKEVSWQRDIKPSDVVKEGDAVSVLVREIDWERNRISLSLRGAQVDPFDAAVARFPVGSAVVGRVTHIEPFGAFVELLPGVEGLVPISKLGSGRRLMSPREVVSEGQSLDLQVETVDFERRRIGLKPLDARVAALNPGALEVGSTVEGIVEGIKEFGIFVRLSETQTGLLHISETEVGKGGNAAAKLERSFAPGSKIAVVVKENDGKRIALTLPARWQKGGDEADEVSTYFQNRSSSGNLGSMGSLFDGLKL